MKSRLHTLLLALLAVLLSATAAQSAVCETVCQTQAGSASCHTTARDTLSGMSHCAGMMEAGASTQAVACHHAQCEHSPTAFFATSPTTSTLVAGMQPMAAARVMLPMPASYPSPRTLRAPPPRLAPVDPHGLSLRL